MIFKPELLWKIEHFFSVKGGEPTDLYLGLMRVAGVFFLLHPSFALLFWFYKRRGAFNEKLTRKIVALTLSLVMCISFSNTTFAYADNENISSSAEASKVNWWKIGWIILQIMWKAYRSRWTE